MQAYLLKDLKTLESSLTPTDHEKFSKLLLKFSDKLALISSAIYEKLDSEDQARFIMWFLKRWSGIDIVPFEEKDNYMKVVRMVQDQPFEKITINNNEYSIKNMDIQGYNFKLVQYPWVLGIHDLYYNQYEHKDFKIEEHDVIIDAGGFIGDTAAIFHYKTNGNCKIHSFELLEENIALFNHNIKELNIAHCVILNQVALTEKSGESVKIKEVEMQGGTNIFGKDETCTEVKTITLDDYVNNNNLVVNLIKMDIEGAEPTALKGSLKTIKSQKPKLAICLYHYWDDIIKISEILNDSDLDYKFYFKWVEMNYGREAVLLALPNT